MNIVNTVAPIAIDDLKVYFEDKNTKYIIDYDQSELKGEKLLVYIGNLDLPCDIKFSGKESAYELLEAYLYSTHIVDVPILEQNTINVLMQHRGFIEKADDEFIDQHQEIIEAWSKKLDSLTLYNMYTIESQQFKDFVTQFPEDDTNDLVGVNFISLLKHQDIYEFISLVDTNNLTFYSKYFNEYMFKGKNMYSYWANENNPLFLLTYGIANGDVNPDEYVQAKSNTIQELTTNDSPV